jgi:hypothetical protein
MNPIPTLAVLQTARALACARRSSGGSQAIRNPASTPLKGRGSLPKSSKHPLHVNLNHFTEHDERNDCDADARYEVIVESLER